MVVEIPPSILPVVKFSREGIHNALKVIIKIQNFIKNALLKNIIL